MRVNRFFVLPDQIREGTAILSPDQSRHLRTVLRLGPGDTVELFDGEGAGYSGIIETVDRTARIGSLRKLKVPEESPRRIVLATAMIQSSRFDWILEKGTELGVDEFIPLKTRFTVARLPKPKLQARMERWKKILQEASKQCRRFTVPQMHEPIDFSHLMNSQSYHDYLKLMLFEKAAESWSSSTMNAESVLLCIGPEGGWDGPEVEEARSAGFRTIGLGHRILRVETAAIAAISLIQYSGHANPQNT